MNKKLKLSLIVIYFLLNNRLIGMNYDNDFMKEFLSVFIPSLGLVGVGAVGIVAYGLYDDYCEKKLPLPERIKLVKRYLLSPNFQTPKRQAQLKKELAELKTELEMQNQKKAAEIKILEKTTHENKSELLKKLNPEKQKLDEFFFLKIMKKYPIQNYNVCSLQPNRYTSSFPIYTTKYIFTTPKYITTITELVSSCFKKASEFSQYKNSDRKKNNTTFDSTLFMYP